MGSDNVLEIVDVSKEYLLYGSHADRVKEVIHPLRKRYHRRFSALKNISFSIKKGEFFGIIGRNGSGKSTLLQLICGILKPTSGTISVKGRIAALLELGAGFNPEFTGRQNVYLNGAILGLNQDEMDKVFEEIIEFADIGEFIDQPVKMYSSGMYVRLAFAVQACVEPDVLVVDEALAVGDIFFRQKCYGRLQALMDRGCTVLFVSHAMNDIEQFCQRVLLLHEGEEIFLGPAGEAVKHYYLVEQEARHGGAVVASDGEPFNSEQIPMPDSEAFNADFFWPNPDAFLDISNVNQVSNRWAHCKGVAVCDCYGNACLSFEQGETASFFYEFELLQDIAVPITGITLRNDKGILVHGKSSLEYGSKSPVAIAKGEHISCRQDISLELGIGEYSVTFGLATISKDNYENSHIVMHELLREKILRICHLPDVFVLSIRLRSSGTPVQLMHHGIANLPGECHIYSNNTCMT